jgi:flagellar hook protein FlgE
MTGLVNGAADLQILAADMSFAGSTQVATSSSLSSFQSDGSAPGTLTGFTIDSQGVINGQYSNGGILSLYKIALADFPGIERLTPAGGTLYAQSPESGDPIIGTPGSGGFGTTLSGGLEQSTVDVAQEFVAMIGAQRGFQANSRVITVADQMYDEVVNLKR